MSPPRGNYPEDVSSQAIRFDGLVRDLARLDAKLDQVLQAVEGVREELEKKPAPAPAKTDEKFLAWLDNRLVLALVAVAVVSAAAAVVVLALFAPGALADLAKIRAGG